MAFLFIISDVISQCCHSSKEACEFSKLAYVSFLMALFTKHDGSGSAQQV